jgi:hypothetical protein
MNKKDRNTEQLRDERTSGRDRFGAELESTTLHEEGVHEVLEDLATVTGAIINGIGEEKQLVVFGTVQSGEHFTVDVSRDEAERRIFLRGLGDEADEFVHEAGGTPGIRKSFNTPGNKLLQRLVEFGVERLHVIRQKTQGATTNTNALFEFSRGHLWVELVLVDNELGLRGILLEGLLQDSLGGVGDAGGGGMNDENALERVRGAHRLLKPFRLVVHHLRIERDSESESVRERIEANIRQIEKMIVKLGSNGSR